MTRLATTVARGYDAAHKAERARWAPSVNAGCVACWRCGRIIIPNPALLGDGWDLGHDDFDRSIWRGPEHRRCNRRAAAILGNKARARRRRSRRW
jgi:hypothetical protein